MALCLPGDEVPLSNANPGPGVAMDVDGVTAFATAAGVVRHAGEEVSVDNLRKRYLPRKGDNVVGIVIGRISEAWRVDIRAPAFAILPAIAFNGATKRNRPAYEIGSLVYARVEASDVGSDVELSCIDPDTKKSWNTGEVMFGELKNGFSFEVALVAAQRFLGVDCYILDRLGQDFPYELCVGQNGRVWLSAPTARETVLLLQAIRRSFGMTDVQVEAMVKKMVETFS
mmetsp:Transcript_158767/g.280483  ORF Transcript_158767/g.280483 Transcript_158767/m.280483 type:complete len:228 (+) Transcript_158767:108-791(+)